MGEYHQQMNLFNEGKDYFKITKPIRLIELFSGIGAQAKALEKLGVPLEQKKSMLGVYGTLCNAATLITKACVVELAYDRMGKDL